MYLSGIPLLSGQYPALISKACLLHRSTLLTSRTLAVSHIRLLGLHAERLDLILIPLFKPASILIERLYCLALFLEKSNIFRSRVPIYERHIVLVAS